MRKEDGAGSFPTSKTRLFAEMCEVAVDECITAGLTRRPRVLEAIHSAIARAHAAALESGESNRHPSFKCTGKRDGCQACLQFSIDRGGQICEHRFGEMQSRLPQRKQQNSQERPAELRRHDWILLLVSNSLTGISSCCCRKIPCVVPAFPRSCSGRHVNR